MKQLFGGLAALLPSDTARKGIGDISAYEGWHNPSVTGFRVRLSHGKICPTRTTRDWSILDQAMNLAHSNGKFISLSVAAGFSVAPWVYTQGVQKYTNADGSGSQPLPWDTKWQSIWFAFIDELSAHIPLASFGSTGKSLSDDVSLAEVIPCGFMTENGMNLGSAIDEAQMPHVGFSDVDTAYVDAAKKILTHYQTAFPTTPLEITYVRPFPTPTGLVIGQEVKDWFAGTYPNQGGTMISSVFANADPGIQPDPGVLPHGGQCYQPAFNNKNPGGLYLPPVPNPIPAYPQPFVDMVNQAVSLGMQKLECYQGDLINCPMDVLTESSSKLKANVKKLGCSAH